MQRILNYLFYCTWRLGVLLDKFLHLIVTAPLIYILKTYFPSHSRERIKALEGLRDNENYVGIHRIFQFMGISTFALFLLGCTTILEVFEVSDEYRVYYLIGVAVIPIYLLYRWCWKGQVYRKYFAQFKKRGAQSLDYIVGFVFHVGVLLLVFLKALDFEFV